LASGTWSNVELNVGVICICMPTLRRFLAHALPRCFGSTEDAATLPAEVNVRTIQSSAKNKGSKKKSTLPDSLFRTTIVKTVDSQVSSAKPEEDEIQLMGLEMNKATSQSGYGGGL
jgi:hypothetical protein